MEHPVCLPYPVSPMQQADVGIQSGFVRYICFKKYLEMFGYLGKTRFMVGIMQTHNLVNTYESYLNLCPYVEYLTKRYKKTNKGNIPCGNICAEGRLHFPLIKTIFVFYLIWLLYSYYTTVICQIISTYRHGRI